MKHIIIYIPGLGDTYDGLRRFALRGWKSRKVSAELIPMQWYEGESYQATFARADAIIREYQKQGFTVSVIGESAGGSMAINLFAANPQIHRLVTIAGVNNPSTSVASYLLRRAPAFKGSIEALHDSLAALSDERRLSIHTFTARADPTVSPHHSHIPGGHDHTINMVGHLATIAVALTLARRRVIRAVAH